MLTSLRLTSPNWVKGFQKVRNYRRKYSWRIWSDQKHIWLRSKDKRGCQRTGPGKNAYQGAATTLSHFNSAADSTKQFHEQVQVLTKNLGSLNAIYELELQDTNNHLKAMNSFYGNLVQASQTMQGSVDDAKKAHEQIAKLANNLSNLNTIYGNMLSAMQGR